MWHLAATAGSVSPEELAKRHSRWRFFQIVFALVYVGIVGDIVTTALGYLKSGSQYEQNPLGGSLIGNLGWPGLAVLMTLLCLVCYHSVRVVYARMSLRWTWLINGAMIFIAAFRWLAVITAVIYLLQPVHGG
jgi:hypothetical protein